MKQRFEKEKKLFCLTKWCRLANKLACFSSNLVSEARPV
jgi:hypothetical protein